MAEENSQDPTTEQVVETPAVDTEVADEEDPDVSQCIDDYLSDGEEDHDEDYVRPNEVSTDTSCLLIIDQLPKVGPGKVEKLTTLLTSRVLARKQLVAGSDKSEKVPPVSFTMPVDEDSETTLGFAVVEYESASIAKAQLAVLDGFSKFKLKLKAYSFVDFQKLCTVPDTLEEKKVEDHPEYQFLQKQTGRELYSWLTDKRVRDQFVIRYGLNTEVHWADTVAGVDLDYGGEREKERDLNWCEMHVMWSPLGTYLLTQHIKGVALWGGPQWEKILRIPCEHVRRVQFSPNENFLFTWNGGGEILDDMDTRASKARKAVTLWNIKGGTKLKSFDYDPFEPEPMGNEWDEPWSYFKWSSDDRYFARAAYAHVDNDEKAEREANILRIYDSKTLKSSSIVAKGVRGCQWSPGTSGEAGSNNIIAYWEPENKKKSRHASVTLKAYPSKKLLRQQTLYNVTRCTIHWQNNGDFMCAHVVRHSASKKTSFTNLELFRIRDRDIPVETLEIRERVHSFAWEPNGVRFCVIHGSTTNTVSIYTMHAVRGGDAYALAWQLDERKSTAIFWSPVGRHAVLAGKGQGSYHGGLVFIDADEEDILATPEHFMCKSVNWDVSGRMVVTAATLPMPMPGQQSQSGDLERGYRVWSFQGEPIAKNDIRDFYQFTWRPRPASLLSDKEREEVIQNISQKARKYKEQDRLLAESDALAKAKEKSNMRTDFHKTMESLHEWYLSEHALRVELHGYDETALPCQEEIFDMEQVIDERRENFQPDEDE